jgi:hypothetical protein
MIHGVIVGNPHSTRGSPVTAGHKRIDPRKADSLPALRSKSNPEAAQTKYGVDRFLPSGTSGTSGGNFRGEFPNFGKFL